ncbi:MAG: GAF domain-containing protein [Candidatus Omnitrophica bacterium]|nr:GAF domain-containing protein [Candidatus Omnitrophota bacterium]MBU0895535.1 GAF domain-containing protein [Candidatus Omnitrophota bacterium]MBU1809271.1 GAF domain-containing protein [Candidatus Omnitrophota bacterium]
MDYFYFPLSGLINAITSILLGVFVLSRNVKTPTNRSFAYFAFSVGFWSYFYFLWLISTTANTALLWCRVLMAGAIFIPPTFFHFCINLIDKRRKHIRAIVYSYFASVIFLILDFTPLYVKNVKPRMIFPYWPSAGVTYVFYLIMFIGLTFYAHVLLFREYRVASGFKRNQILYVFLGTAIGFIGGATNYPLWYDVNILPIGNILVSVYVASIAYAIIRHHLMDIEVVVKKTVVFASLFVIVYGIFVSITLLTQEMLAGGRLLGLAISSLVIIFTVRPMEILLVRVTDKYLFQKRYNYKYLIKEFMDELKTMVLNMNGIAQSTVDFFMSSIRPTSAAIFIHNKFTNRYDLVASSEFKNKGYKVETNSQLIKILSQTGKIIRTDSDELVSAQEQDRLKVMGTELIIPLLAQKELIGLLCLGKKKSDEDYTEDDIGTLSDLSGALSISLKNAQLFDERADAEKRALVGTIATGINHEVGNPLNIITIKLETFRILAREGMMDHKSKDEIMAEVSDITKVCLDNVQRISEITKQVSEFAKPDRKIVFDKVNIGEAIDETMAVLKHGMILPAGKIEKKFMCDPVYAVADKGQLKQILFNLIKNASHAITGEKGKIVVSVDKNDNGEIAIKVIDNGCGMPKEVRDKLFTPFFTTKDPGKGTGLGLALVKIMVDRNDGRIKVESQEGQGTTFTLVFKGGLL